MRDGDEVPGVGREGREHERHPIHDQRFGDAVHQPLAQALEVEIAVQIAGEADQGAPVVVAVAVVDPIEPGLDRVLDRARQQHDDESREQRDDRILLLVGVAQENRAGRAQQDGVDGGDRRQRRGVDQRALDDHLDVHQAVAHDGGSERQRDETEQQGAELEAPQRLEPEGERQRVAHDEGHRPERGAPHNPA